MSLGHSATVHVAHARKAIAQADASLKRARRGACAKKHRDVDAATRQLHAAQDHVESAGHAAKPLLKRLRALGRRVEKAHTKFSRECVR